MDFLNKVNERKTVVRMFLGKIQQKLQQKLACRRCGESFPYDTGEMLKFIQLLTSTSFLFVKFVIWCQGFIMKHSSLGLSRNQQDKIGILHKQVTQEFNKVN